MQSKYDLVLESFRQEEEESGRNRLKAVLYMFLTAAVALLVIFFIKIGQPSPPLPLMSGSLGMLGLDNVGVDHNFEGALPGKPKENDIQASQAQTGKSQSTLTDPNGENAVLQTASYMKTKPASQLQTGSTSHQTLDSRFHFQFGQDPSGNVNGDSNSATATHEGRPGGSDKDGTGLPSLAGRSLLARSHKHFISDRIGRVVVQITVDKAGNVVYAEYNMKGSKNILDNSFIQSCVDDAKEKFKFSPATGNSFGYAVGQIVYDFH
jgi:hypothetical protein